MNQTTNYEGLIYPQRIKSKEINLLKVNIILSFVEYIPQKIFYCFLLKIKKYVTVKLFE